MTVDLSTVTRAWAQSLAHLDSGEEDKISVLLQIASTPGSGKARPVAGEQRPALHGRAYCPQHAGAWLTDHI